MYTCRATCVPKFANTNFKFKGKVHKHLSIHTLDRFVPGGKVRALKFETLVIFRPCELSVKLFL